jgi:hypothetical protein
VEVQVVDTNVAIVANDARLALDDPGRRPIDCIEACIDAVLRLTQSGGLVLDADGEILEQYSKYLSRAGQPGTGDVFMKWVHDNQWNEDVCTRISVTQDAKRGYLEFPNDPALKGFDWDDRVFVAVVMAHPDWPTILQAVDAKWRKWEAALRANLVDVEFLCG